MVGKLGSRVTAVAAVALALIACSASAQAAPRTHAVTLGSLESGVLADINAFRVQHRLARLRPNARLARAAMQHTEQMAQRGYFAHTSADGSPFWRRIRRFYAASPWRYWSVGENLLWSSPDVGPAQALQLWLHSPEHRANLMNPRWREIGVAAVHAQHAPGAFRGLDVTIVTTDFGVRR